MNYLVNLIKNNFNISYKNEQKNNIFLTLDNEEGSVITLRNCDDRIGVEVSSFQKSTELDNLFTNNNIKLESEINNKNNNSYLGLYCYIKNNDNKPEILNKTQIESKININNPINHIIETEEVKQYNNIIDLGISLEDLYNNKKQINIFVENKPHVFHVVLKDRFEKDDCKISSLAPLVHGRTNSGIKGLRFSTLEDLENEITNWIRNNFDDENLISFGLSDKIRVY